MSDEAGPKTILGLKLLKNWPEHSKDYRSLHFRVVCVSLAVACFVTGRLWMQLASTEPGSATAWPVRGIALVAFLVLGYRVWPAILVGSFLVHLTTFWSIPGALVIALGNTAEGLLAAYFVNRFAGGLNVFQQAQTISLFVLLAVGLSTTVGASFGAASVYLSGRTAWADLQSLWLVWWLQGAVGIALVAPFVLPWFSTPLPCWTRRKLLEAIALAICLILASLLVFGDLFQSGIGNYPLDFLCIPILLWAAFRFGALESAIAVPILSGIAIWGTVHGYGPFARVFRAESLLLLESFLGVISLMTIAVAGIVSESRRGAEELRMARDKLSKMVVTDPLTGLANYRRLDEMFKAETERSRRTGRSFALLLLDLDGLKKINDTHGHLVGSNAIRRVARSLEFHSRGVDTAARYGGDEFALLLPETAVERAGTVAQRITEQIASDNEHPPISASYGIAVYPQDGETIEEIFKAADAALYEMKIHRSGRRPA